MQSTHYTAKFKVTKTVVTKEIPSRAFVDIECVSDEITPQTRSFPKQWYTKITNFI